jgi:hypothetical protein
MTTSFNTALATPQYTTIRSGRYAADRLLYLFKNTAVFAGQINSDLTTPQTWASFLYNNVTVGAYTDVREGMVLYIGTTNDLFAAAKSGFYGRTRLVPDATTFYCNESSEDFNVGNYFWVISRYDIQYKLSRPTPGTNVELVDYDIPYQGLPPRVVGLQTGYMAYVNPLSSKLRLGFDISASEAAESGKTVASYAYAFDSGTLVAGSLSGPICIMDFDPGEQYGGADVIDTAGINLQRRFGIVALDDTLYPPDTGYSNGSVGGTLDQGYTLTIPAFKDVDSVLYNSFAIAIRANEQYGGTVQTLYGGGSAAITNKVLTSQTATLTATGHPYQTGQAVIVVDVGTQFNGTFVITATTANTFSYHSAQANVGSTGCSGMSVVNPPKPDFVGWLNRENDPLAGDPVYSTKTGAEFTFTGVAPRLARLTAQLLAMVLSTDTRWGDIPSLAWWRAIWHFLARYTTAAVSCDVTFSDTTDEFQFPDISTEGQDALGAIRWIAAMVNAIPEFAPWGAIAVNRDVNYLSQAERNLTTVVAAFTDADFLEAPRSIDPNQTVGKVDTDAAVYNTANSQVTVFTARAPGHAQGEASGSETLPGQALAASPDMVAALNEARQRVSQKFEIDNLREFLDVRWKAGWVGIGLIPSRSQVYTVTLSNVGGPNGVNRVEYDTSTLWTLEGITVEYDAGRGQLIPRGKLRRVADIGGPGDNTTQNIPAANSVADPFPDLGSPAFDFELPAVTFPDVGLDLSQVNPVQLLPPKGKVATFRGQELLVWSADNAYYLKNFITLKKPQSVNITPSDLGSYEIQQGVIDPFYTNLIIPGYELATDNANSAVWYCPNIAAAGASGASVKGTDAAGVYRVLRSTNVLSDTLIYSPASTGGTVTKTVTFDSGSYPYALVAGTFSGSGGNPNGNIYSTDPSAPPNNSCLCRVRVYLPAPSTITNLKQDYWEDVGTPNLVVDYYLYDDTGTELVHGTSTLIGIPQSTWATKDWGVLNVPNVAYVEFRNAVSNYANAGTNTVRLDNCVISYTTLSGGNAAVRLISDYGATAGSAMVVGTSPGSSGGFDVARDSGYSFAAADGVVARATTIGGSYSNWYTVTGGAQAACIIVPYFNWSGTVQVSSANPDILVGLTAPDGSSRTLLWIEGGATPGTVHDLTPVAGFVFSGPNAITISYNHHLAVIGSVSGSNRLYTTNDKGVTWVNRGSVTLPTFIRVRRNDDTAAVSGANEGQLYMAEGGSTAVVDYSSFWASGSGPDANMWPRTMPSDGIVGFDTVF